MRSLVASLKCNPCLQCNPERAHTSWRATRRAWAKKKTRGERAVELALLLAPTAEQAADRATREALRTMIRNRRRSFLFIFDGVDVLVW